MADPAPPSAGLSHVRGRSALAVALIAALPYLPNLGAPLQWDDRTVLLESRFTWNWENAPALLRPAKYAEVNWPSGPTFRPLADLSFFLDYSLWRHRPPAARAVNLLAHMSVAACAFLLLAELVTPAAAWWGAVLWALHPVHSEIVLCNIFRRASLATLFMLVALLAWRKGRTGWALASFGAGLLMKETAAVLPALILVHDRLLGQRSWRGMPRRPRRDMFRTAAPGYAGLWIILAVYLVAYVALVPTPVLSVPTGEALLDNWRTVLGTLPTYLRLTFWPWPLAVDHLPQTTSLRVAGGGVLLLMYLAATLWTAGRAKLVAFGLAWIGLAHLPTAHLLPAGETYYYVAERFLYAPLIGIALVVAWALARDPQPRARLGAAGVAAIFAFLVLLRGSDWQSGVRLFGSNLLQFPTAYRSRYNLALSLQDARRFEEAANAYRATLAIRPDLHLAQNNLGICLKARGRLDEAEAAYRAALVLQPGDARPMLNLGHLASRRGRTVAAAAWYRKAAEAVPSNPEPHRLLGKIAFEAGRLKEADREFAEYERLGGGLVGTAPR